MADGSTSDRLSFAMSNVPPSRSGKGRSSVFGDMGAMMWALGAPGFSSANGQNLNEWYYMQAIRQGRDPSTVLPFLKGGSGSGAASSTKNPIAGMPQWYQDWYNAKGKFGGVPPVQGLL